MKHERDPYIFTFFTFFTFSAVFGLGYNNIYGDREIKDYIKRRPGESEQQHQLRFILESERIKKEILDFELDMWGY